MGVFDVRWLVANAPELSKFQTAVESGTLTGTSTAIMSGLFQRIYTIEVDDELYLSACRRFAGDEQITCINGDSAQVIAQLAREIDQPCVWYLDAHWSGDSSVDWAASHWKGYGLSTGHRGPSGRPTSRDQVPLIDELDAIARTFTPPAIIYVDDLDKFDSDLVGRSNVAFCGEDWSSVDLGGWISRTSSRIAFVRRSEFQMLVGLHPAFAKG